MIDRNKYPLDDEVMAFITKCDDLYDPDTASCEPEEQRRRYNALCRNFDAGRPAREALRRAADLGRGGSDDEGRPAPCGRQRARCRLQRDRRRGPQAQAMAATLAARLLTDLSLHRSS